MDLEIAKAQIAAARYNCKEGWPFPDAKIVIDGYEEAIKEIEQLRAENKNLKKERDAAQNRFETMAALADKRGIALQRTIEECERALKK